MTQAAGDEVGAQSVIFAVLGHGGCADLGVQGRGDCVEKDARLGGKRNWFIRNTPLPNPSPTTLMTRRKERAPGQGHAHQNCVIPPVTCVPTEEQVNAQGKKQHVSNVCGQRTGEVSLK